MIRGPLLSSSSSSDSLEHNLSSILSTTSLNAPSESSNSAINCGGFSSFGDIDNSTIITSSSLALSNINNYEDNNTTCHHEPYLSSTASTSDVISPSSTPLFVINPCYQPPIFLPQQITGNFTENFRMDHSFHDAIRPPHRCMSTRRTISLQSIQTLATIFDGTRLAKQPSCNSKNEHSQYLQFSDTPVYDHQLYIQNCSAASIDWLHEAALFRLIKLLEIHSIDFATSKRWQKRMLRVMSIKSSFRQSHAGKRQETIQDIPVTDAERGDQLYGMSLSKIQASSDDGNPLPQFVLDIIEYLTKNAKFADGIFRKNGVNMRIQEIKVQCSSLSPNQPIPHHLLIDSTVHDLADSLKRYFRDLPECLFTDRISEMLEDVLRDLPAEKYFDVMHYCILLLPEENREALMLLLRFLKEITLHSATNQMTAENLAICWFPSLFCLSHTNTNFKNDAMSAVGRRLARRKTAGLTNEKEWKALEAIKKILSKMIDNWERLLYLSESFYDAINSNGLENCHALAVPVKNSQIDFTNELHENFKRQLYRLKEDHFSGWKSWQLQRVFPDGTHLFSHTINDMAPLKAFRVQTGITASSNLILANILHGRSLWDSNVIGYKRIGPSGWNFDIVEMQYRSTIGILKKHSLLARWTYSEFDDDSICSLIECSITPRGERSHKQNSFFGDVNVFESKFLILPICHDHSLLIHISRIDLKGRSSKWYERVYGEMLVKQIQRLKQELYKCENNSIEESSV